MTSDEYNKIHAVQTLLVQIRKEQHEMSIELERLVTVIDHLVSIMSPKPELMKAKG
jgi:hypothetical protein